MSRLEVIEQVIAYLSERDSASMQDIAEHLERGDNDILDAVDYFWYIGHRTAVPVRYSLAYPYRDSTSEYQRKVLCDEIKRVFLKQSPGTPLGPHAVCEALPRPNFTDIEATLYNNPRIFDIHFMPGYETFVLTPPVSYLAGMAERVAMVNEANGWYDAERTFGDDIALLHSEVSEALEAYRSSGLEASVSGKGKPEGAPSEFADVLIRLLDTCSRYGIDLEAEFNAKLAYNETRGHRHGGKLL